MNCQYYMSFTTALAVINILAVACHYFSFSPKCNVIFQFLTLKLSKRDLWFFARKIFPKVFKILLIYVLALSVVYLSLRCSYDICFSAGKSWRCLNFFRWINFFLPASWSSGNAFVSGAGGLRFKSQAGQIGHSIANGSPPLRHFFKRSCVARAQWRGDGPRQLVTRFGELQRV